jgi:hypothetical protein
MTTRARDKAHAATPSAASRQRDATIADLLEFIWPRYRETPRVPWWPPDVFAVSATILRRTGGYVRVLQLRDKSRGDCIKRDWPETAEALAVKWRENVIRMLKSQPEIRVDFFQGARSASRRSVVPKEVRGWWKKLLAAQGKPISSIENEASELTMALVKLCCVADEASEGVGIRSVGGDSFMKFADQVLTRNECRTLCISVPRDRIAVLPKQHTPQRGLTLRSLTHHLSLHPATEVMPKWRFPVRGPKLEMINLLLLPWPTETIAKDFRVLTDKDDIAPELPDSFRFFSYEPTDPWGKMGLQARLAKAFAHAEKHAERIHGIVFPELALSFPEFREVERFAVEKQTLLMAGVRAADGEFGKALRHNAWAFQTRGLELPPTEKEEELDDDDYAISRVSQAKHHRWCLDRSQILQYGLGGRLPASKDCWELTDITSREVEFFTIDSWLTWAVLICEDLARQDPVAEVIRSVGPNMVIALLMDGPQLKERWPSRYASVLAEDPGSSVLTLTSLGMCRRTRAGHRNNDRSNVIALWRDVNYGVREIELGEKDDACVLSLVCKSLIEYTADGRGDDGSAHFPVFAGVYPFNSSDP